MAKRGHLRARRGREMRGPLLPPTVPGWRSRAERFDMAVLEAYEPIERRWQPTGCPTLDVAVDEIPRIVTEGSRQRAVAAGGDRRRTDRARPADPGRASTSGATPRGRESCCSASQSSDGPRTPSTWQSCCTKFWWPRWPRIWASSPRSSTRRSTTNDAAGLARQMMPRLRRRRSRSERPPQMPKRSSWARAYSRHSSRHLAAQADPLGLAGRAALLGEERLGIGLRAQRALLPLVVVGVSGRVIVNRLGHQTQLRTSEASNRRRSGIGVRCAAY